MSNTASSEPLKVVVGVSPPMPLSAIERFSRALTRPAVALPLMALSAALLGWSVLYRLPKAPVVVKARSAQSSGSNDMLTAEAVAELERTAQRAAQDMSRESKEIAPALAELEQSARALGFKIEVSMKAAITNAAGFNQLTIVPAAIRLENNYNQHRPAFSRALDWLRQAAALPGKVEINALSLRSDGNGFTRAELEVHFWRSNYPEQASAPPL